MLADEPLVEVEPPSSSTSRSSSAGRRTISSTVPSVAGDRRISSRAAAQLLRAAVRHRQTAQRWIAATGPPRGSTSDRVGISVWSVMSSPSGERVGRRSASNAFRSYRGLLESRESPGNAHLDVERRRMTVLQCSFRQRSALAVVLLALVGVALVAVPAAAAGADESALAEKFAPVVRLVDQPEECGPGEPYIPTDVDVLFDEPTVAFRGPWNRTDLVKIGPAATDLVNRYEYHLDFPGDPLDAGLRLRALGAPPDERDEADRVRPRRHRSRLPRQARAPVLVLLPVQRFQQHARGRLGDDPARLRRCRRVRRR